MPELPEVETTRLGIAPHLIGRCITEVIIRRWDLRQEISPEIAEWAGATFKSIDRRSKYLLLHTDRDETLIIHLGMSGSLRIVSARDDWKKHDHIGMNIEGGLQLRYHDPRRFGLALVWPTSNLVNHPLLCHLGPEPLSDKFTAIYLHAVLKNKQIAIKVAIMDAKIVVGVGNIYASESLFRAGIHPCMPSKNLSMSMAKLLTDAIRQVLKESIEQGGTTLRDFLNSDGNPGYFKQHLFVYGRKGESCRNCDSHISHKILGQRATFWCEKCQSGG